MTQFQTQFQMQSQSSAQSQTQTQPSAESQSQSQSQSQNQTELRTQIQVEHETFYTYQTDVELAHHLAYLRPLSSDWQQVLTSEVEIQPTPGNKSESKDAFGNMRTFFTLATPHTELVVRSISTVELRDRYGKFDMAQSPEWEDVREALSYALDRPYLPASEFAFSSPFIPRLKELREYALLSFTKRRNIAQASMDLSSRIHRDFKYASGATEVHTPLLEAFTKRAGVCQDFSHILIGCLRSIGLSAQYVSGYLLTKPLPGQVKLRGADASHAWVSVYCPTAPGQWLELDPTNDVIAGAGHVRLAIGRDFGDVSPLRGVIRGGGEHILKIAVTAEEVQV
jgi:transglutaminase-like putative cysteine protease